MGRAQAYDGRMPELPEVETVCRGLAPYLEGQRIAHVHLARPDLRFPFPEGFAARLRGATVCHFGRRAKYLLAEMEKDGARFFWLSHLGMSGRFIYKHEIPDKHVHVRFEMEDGTVLHYADPRRFGFMDLIEGAPETSPFLAHLGPEPLSNAFHLDMLVAACAGRKSPIKNVLLDQRVVAGLGNIYVCEALFMARISPRRLAAHVGPKRLARLVPAICDVLAQAIDAGGSSLRDFADSDGKLGYFQHHFLVYDREGLACPTPKCRASIQRIVQSGRSSFFCPKCQR